jgi:hypothetical protein
MLLQTRLLRVVLVLVGLLHLACAGSMSKPHSNQGILQPYDGKHISYNITAEQNNQLKAGQPVSFSIRSEKAGRGVALQDIAAPPHICMDRISDLVNYPKMVPKVRKVEIYQDEKFDNGTSKIGANFEVGLFPLTFSYYLLLTYEPKYQTFTWTLDYRYSSDFGKWGCFVVWEVPLISLCSTTDIPLSLYPSIALSLYPSYRSDSSPPLPPLPPP